MRRSEVQKWLAENGGQADYDENAVAIKTVDPYDDSKTISKTQLQITWIAKNGKRLTIIDPMRSDGYTPSQADIDKNTTPGGEYDPEYQVVSDGFPKGEDPAAKTDTRTPEKKTKEEIEHNEAMWNMLNGPGMPGTSPEHAGRGSGRYETHTEREKREANVTQESDRQEDRRARTRTEERQAGNESARIDIERDRLEIARRAEDRQISLAEAEAEINREKLGIEKDKVGIDKDRLGVEKDRLGVDKDRLQLEREGTVTTVGTPTDEDQYISQINNRTGVVSTVENPNYDPLKKAATAKREEIKLQIEAGKFSAEVGAQRYKEWYETNITAPIQLSQERRAQAQEARAAQELEDKRRYQKAQNEIQRAQVGQQAAEIASENERSLLPFRVGEKFAPQFSSAINSLAAGGKMDANAAAGINFTPDAFEFDAPNFKKIAKNAAKEALKHLTPYDPDDDAPAVADYSGLIMPTPETLQGAPVSGYPSQEVVDGILSGAGIAPYAIPVNSDT